MVSSLLKKDKRRNVILLPVVIIISMWSVELQQVFCDSNMNEPMKLHSDKMQNSGSFMIVLSHWLYHTEI